MSVDDNNKQASVYALASSANLGCDVENYYINEDGKEVLIVLLLDRKVRVKFVGNAVEGADVTLEVNTKETARRIVGTPQRLDMNNLTFPNFMVDDRLLIIRMIAIYSGLMSGINPTKDILEEFVPYDADHIGAYEAHGRDGYSITFTHKDRSVRVDDGAMLNFRLLRDSDQVKGICEFSYSKDRDYCSTWFAMWLLGYDLNFNHL